jgi:hypothetical protein
MSIRAGAAVSRGGPTSGDLDLLALVARLPLISAPQLGRLAGNQALVYRRLARLRRLGLVAAVGCHARARGRPADLLRVTPRGRTFVAARAKQESTRRPSVTGVWSLPTHELTGLLACYELLVQLVDAEGGPAMLLGWERPWRRTYRPIPGRAVRRVRVLAAVTLAWPKPEGTKSRSYLLLPDLGGRPLTAWRPRLMQLAQLQRAHRERIPALAIGTTSEIRAAGWRRLLAETARATHGSLLETRIVTATLSESWGLAGLRLAAAVTRHREQTSPGCSPLGPRDLELLGVIGRHPFLPTALLAALLGQDRRRLSLRLARVVRLGLLRLVPQAELSTAREAARDRHLELTGLGLAAVAAHLGLPPAAAARQHGLAGGGPAAPYGWRESLLAQPAHTLGADRVMIGLAAAARADPRRGYLAEWRSAAACAHGRLRPDAYGVLHVLGYDCGFFLEFDRGTMRPAELRAKFLVYHRFRASRRSAQLYSSFPTILVVTTGGPGAEHRLADAVRAVDASFAAPLPVLLTTTAWIDAHPQGMLGAIWRTPQQASRRAWPRLAGPLNPQGYPCRLA